MKKFLKYFFFGVLAICLVGVVAWILSGNYREKRAQEIYMQAAQTNDPARKVAFLRQAAFLSSKDTKYWNEGGQILSRHGSYAKAREFLKVAAKKDNKYLNDLITNDLQAGRPDWSTEDFKLCPARCLIPQARSLLANKEFSEVAKLGETEPEAKKYVVIAELINKTVGPKYVLTEDLKFNLAKEGFEDIVTIANPSSALTFIAKDWQDTDDSYLAFILVRQATKIDPDNRDAWLLKAVLARRFNQKDEAREASQKAKAIDPIYDKAL